MGKTISMGPGVELDINVLVESRLLIQANSGAGKSYAIRRLLEQSHGKIQHIVIDPEGEFATLRERFDYVLVAKTEGDVVASPRTAKVLAERLLELNASAIIDIYELNPRDRVLFVRRFVEALVDVPKKLWHPVLVVLDEAHVYCPEKGQAESSEAVKALCTRGRKRGFCAVLATQRLSKLHKDAAAECNNKMIGRSSLDIDMRRSSEEIGFSNKDNNLTWRKLKPGEFYVFGPAVSEVVKKIKVGSVSTTHPESGGRIGYDVPPPTKKVVAILSKLSDLQQESENRERTMAEAKAEIASLKKQLSIALKESKKTPTLVEKVVDPKFVRGLQGLRGGVTALLRAAGEVDKSIERMLSTAQEKPETKRAPSVVHRQDQTRSADRSVDRGLVEDFTGPEQRIVDAIAWMESIGIKEPPIVTVAFLAGYSPRGGAFNNPKGKLRSKGLVEYVAPKRIRLTDAGMDEACMPMDTPTDEELHSKVLDRLNGPQRKLLQALLDNYPEPMSNEELAHAAGYSPSGGAFNNPKGFLRTMGLVSYPSTGIIVAKDLLFPSIPAYGNQGDGQ